MEETSTTLVLSGEDMILLTCAHDLVSAGGPEEYRTSFPEFLRDLLRDVAENILNLPAIAENILKHREDHPDMTSIDGIAENLGYPADLIAVVIVGCYRESVGASPLMRPRLEVPS